MENVNLWEVLTEYNATKRYGIFLTNEDGEIQENQLPFFNVVLICFKLMGRLMKNQSVASVRCAEPIVSSI